MTHALPPLLSLRVEPRRCLALFDIADDPVYVAMEVQAFDDAVHGRGILALLARHDGTVDVHRQASLRLEPERFAVGRGVGTWRVARFERDRIEVERDGLLVDVELTDGDGRRIVVHIDDRDGSPRTRSTLLAPVSSGVERPTQLLVVLLRDFDLARTSGATPRLEIDGVARTITPFPGPAWVTRRRFIRAAGSPLIVTAMPDRDGPVDPASLGPVEVVRGSAPDGAAAALRFEPPLPDLAAVEDGSPRAGRWVLDIDAVRPVFGGRWTVRRRASIVRVELLVTEPWRPSGLPRSLRLVTTVARVFREWPLTYRWDAEIDVGVAPPVARTAWSRTTPPNRANAYGIRVPRGIAGRRIVVAALLGLAAGVLSLAITVTGRRGRREHRGSRGAA